MGINKQPCLSEFGHKRGGLISCQMESGYSVIIISHLFSDHTIHFVSVSTSLEIVRYKGFKTMLLKLDFFFQFA